MDSLFQLSSDHSWAELPVTLELEFYRITTSEILIWTE